MLPPFHLPSVHSEFDHRPFEERRVIRRSAPEVLRLDPVPPGAPFLHVAPRHRPAPLASPVPSRAERGWFARLWRRPVAAPVP